MSTATLKHAIDFTVMNVFDREKDTFKYQLHWCVWDLFLYYFVERDFKPVPFQGVITIFMKETK